MLYSHFRDEESEVKIKDSVKLTSLINVRATNRERKLALINAYSVPGTTFSHVILNSLGTSLILMKKLSQRVDKHTNLLPLISKIRI